jgi:uncharacterized protein
MIKELVTFLVKQLVAHPAEVIVQFIEQEDRNLLEITVAPQDRGRVIGKEGHTIKSLRILVDAMLTDEKKVILELAR